MNYCCERMRRAVAEDLIRQTDRYGHMHLTPTERGCSDTSISYCPFCGRGQRGEIRERQDREQAVLDAYYAGQIGEDF